MKAHLFALLLVIGSSPCFGDESETEVVLQLSKRVVSLLKSELAEGKLSLVRGDLTEFVGASVADLKPDDNGGTRTSVKLETNGEYVVEAFSGDSLAGVSTLPVGLLRVSALSPVRWSFKEFEHEVVKLEIRELPPNFEKWRTRWVILEFSYNEGQEMLWSHYLKSGEESSASIVVPAKAMLKRGTLYAIDEARRLSSWKLVEAGSNTSGNASGDREIIVRPEKAR